MFGPTLLTNKYATICLPFSEIYIRSLFTHNFCRQLMKPQAEQCCIKKQGKDCNLKKSLNSDSSYQLTNIKEYTHSR